MVRRFLTLRWVTIHLLTIAIVVIFILFGRWQLHRWEGRGVSVVPPDNRPAVALTDLVSADQPLRGGSIGRQTVVTGRFDGAHQVLIADKQQAGRSGFWVVTPLQPQAGTAGTSTPATPAALVVRGWVPSATDPAVTVPSTPYTVHGRLYASEDPPPIGTNTGPALPPGQFREVNTAELTASFPYRILDGYVLLGSTEPTLSAPTAAVVPVPVNEVNHGGGLRNLAYAVQWWLFAGAVLYFWGRLIRDDLRPPEDRVHEPSPVTPREHTPVRIPVDIPRPTGSGGSSDEPDPSPEPEDAELAAYNRYLADLNARSGRSRN
ncbi:MAG TPA: SURF1 family protein [Frankiaceae bacterium]|nr:SURF1 family protein [Frankiaceae bacterium]